MSGSSHPSLFWSEAELMKTKLWGDSSDEINANISSNNNNNNNNNSSGISANNNKTEDNACDEEGIANGIRAIEIRLENELEEQEKLWPDPDNLA